MLTSLDDVVYKILKRMAKIIHYISRLYIYRILMIAVHMSYSYSTTSSVRNEIHFISIGHTQTLL